MDRGGREEWIEEERKEGMEEEGGKEREGIRKGEEGREGCFYRGFACVLITKQLNDTSGLTKQDVFTGIV